MINNSFSVKMNKKDKIRSEQTLQTLGDRHRRCVQVFALVAQEKVRRVDHCESQPQGQHTSVSTRAEGSGRGAS